MSFNIAHGYIHGCYKVLHVIEVSVAQGVGGGLKEGLNIPSSTLPHSCLSSYDCAFQDPLYGSSPKAIWTFDVCIVSSAAGHKVLLTQFKAIGQH